MLDLRTVAVVLDGPERLDVRELRLNPPADDEVVVEIGISGVSTGTERLLWRGEMPSFPGMRYPLVPGYESVGRISHAGCQSGRKVGQLVFVPGARCYKEAQGLFGGAAARVVLEGQRTFVIDERFGEQGILLALAATAHNALRKPEGGYRCPELIVGHGVLGHLMARLAVSIGKVPPVVWEKDPRRITGRENYPVIHPDEDTEGRYETICDVTGDASLLDSLIGRLAAGGEIILAGFYQQPLTFSFVPAFIRKARIRIAAEWEHQDLIKVYELALNDDLSLDGLITHRQPATEALEAYRTAFSDSDCLKMALEWMPATSSNNVGYRNDDPVALYASGRHH